MGPRVQRLTQVGDTGYTAAEIQKKSHRLPMVVSSLGRCFPRMAGRHRTIRRPGSFWWRTSDCKTIGKFYEASLQILLRLRSISRLFIVSLALRVWRYCSLKVAGHSGSYQGTMPSKQTVENSPYILPPIVTLLSIICFASCQALITKIVRRTVAKHNARGMPRGPRT